MLDTEYCFVASLVNIPNDFTHLYWYYCVFLRYASLV